MQITKISLLEKKNLDKDRIYFKVEITWDNSKKEIEELWGIEDNILITKNYRPDIEKIIFHFNHDKVWAPPRTKNKYFFPLRYFIKEVPLAYENEIREWVMTGVSSYIKELPCKYKGYIFYDKVANVALPLCQFDWFTDNLAEFEKWLVDAWGERILTTTYALVAKWSIKRQVHYLWKIKNYSKRDLLLEDCGLYDEQLEKVQKCLIFTCPVCNDESTPAGLAKLPKPFYNHNKELLATEFKDTFKIKISDPNSVLENYSHVENIMQAISSAECPATISYNQYKKIANSIILQNNSITYKDYVRMIKEMGGDFILPWDITSVEQLDHLHVNTITEYNLCKDQSNEHMKQKYLKIKKDYPKFETSNDEFIIKYPDDLDDLNVEGSVLHHCVRSYKGRILDGSAIIVLLRTVKDPDVPFVTMQLQKMSNNEYDLVQAHGNCNCSIKSIEGVYDFVSNWCKQMGITMENIDRAL